MGQALFDGGDTEQQHQQHQQQQHQFSRRPSAFNKVAATATTANYNWFAVGVGFLVVGLTCSMLDLNRIWCNPQNHVVQGHAVWHLFTALALMCQFQHYTQFQSKSSSNAAAAALSGSSSFSLSPSATKQNVALVGAIRAGVGAIFAAKEKLSSGSGGEGDGEDREDTGFYRHKFVKSHRRAISVDVERLVLHQPSCNNNLGADTVTSAGSMGLIAHRRNKSYDSLRLL